MPGVDQTLFAKYMHSANNAGVAATEEGRAAGQIMQQGGEVPQAHMDRAVQHIRQVSPPAAFQAEINQGQDKDPRHIAEVAGKLAKSQEVELSTLRGGLLGLASAAVSHQDAVNGSESMSAIQAAADGLTEAQESGGSPEAVAQHTKTLEGAIRDALAQPSEESGLSDGSRQALQGHVGQIDAVEKAKDGYLKQQTQAVRQGLQEDLKKMKEAYTGRDNKGIEKDLTLDTHVDAKHANETMKKLEELLAIEGLLSAAQMAQAKNVHQDTEEALSKAPEVRKSSAVKEATKNANGKWTIGKISNGGDKPVEIVIKPNVHEEKQTGNAGSKARARRYDAAKEGQAAAEKLQKEHGHKLGGKQVVAMKVGNDLTFFKVSEAEYNKLQKTKWFGDDNRVFSLEQIQKSIDGFTVEKNIQDPTHPNSLRNDGDEFSSSALADTCIEVYKERTGWSKVADHNKDEIGVHPAGTHSSEQGGEMKVVGGAENPAPSAPEADPVLGTQPGEAPNPGAGGADSGGRPAGMGNVGNGRDVTSLPAGMTVSVFSEPVPAPTNPQDHPRVAGDGFPLNQQPDHAAEVTNG